MNSREARNRRFLARLFSGTGGGHGVIIDPAMPLEQARALHDFMRAPFPRSAIAQEVPL